MTLLRKVYECIFDSRELNIYLGRRNINQCQLENRDERKELFFDSWFLFSQRMLSDVYGTITFHTKSLGSRDKYGTVFTLHNNTLGSKGDK